MAKVEKPMPIRWQQIIDIMPQHNWHYTTAAMAIPQPYSPKYARTTLPGILKGDARFCKALEAKKNALAEKYNISSDRVIKEQASIAFADPSEIIGEDGEVLSLHEMPERVRCAVSAVEIEELWEGRGEERRRIGEIKKVKFWDKPKVLEQLCKMLGLFAEDNGQRQTRQTIIFQDQNGKVLVSNAGRIGSSQDDYIRALSE